MQDWTRFTADGRPPLPQVKRRMVRRLDPHDPPVTVAEMVETYRAVLPRCSPFFAYVLRDLMARCAAGARETGEEG